MYRVSRSRLRLIMMPLLLTGVVLTLAAQSGDPQKPPEKAPIAEPKRARDIPAARESDTQTVSPTDAASQSADNQPVEVAPKTDINSAPFEYKPSEEISEDLSVSFPVDI